MKRISYLKLQEKYGGEFIAARKSRIVAHAKTMEALFRRLKKRGISYGPAIRIGRVHPSDAVCIYVLFD